jgi:hypothetical protein
MSSDCFAVIWCRRSHGIQWEWLARVRRVGELVKQVENGPFMVENGECKESRVEVGESQCLAWVALNQFALDQIGGMVDVGRNGWARRAWTRSVKERGFGRGKSPVNNAPHEIEAGIVSFLCRRLVFLRNLRDQVGYQAVDSGTDAIGRHCCMVAGVRQWGL